MKYLLSAAVAYVLLTSPMAFAQLTIVSTTPADGATNVPLITTISVTFSGPLDTLKPFDTKISFITMVDNSITSRRYSADGRTVFFDVILKSNSPYFFIVSYAPGAGNQKLQTPTCVHFTTGAALGGHTVRGIIQGSPGVTPGNAVVALSLVSVSTGNPIFADGGVADTNGNFSIPYVPDGTYFPLSVKDVNSDGCIDPGRGDVLGIANPITVNGADIGGINMTLVAYPPTGFADASHTADSLSRLLLPYDNVLRQVQGFDIDSLGNPATWQFYSTSASSGAGYRIDIASYQKKIAILDSSTSHGFIAMKPIGSLPAAAVPGSFVANVERFGGAAFRHLSMPRSLTLQANLLLGDLRRTDFGDVIPDTGKLYWGLEYQYGSRDVHNVWHSVMQQQYVGEYSTGSLLIAPFSIVRTILAHPGWNMCSLPLGVADRSKEALFPSVTSRAFYYNGLYRPQDSLDQGLGYWLKFPASQSVPLSGFLIHQLTIPVRAGWNMIGSISENISVASIQSDPPGIITGRFFGYDNGYTFTDSIYAGGAYWVKANLPGELILSVGSTAPPANLIRIVETGEVPPDPPGDAATIANDPAAEYMLTQCSPNPANPQTIIGYKVPVESHVTMTVYNMLGERVAVLVDGTQAAGFYQTVFDGAGLASGVYFYHIIAGKITPGAEPAFTQTRKFVLLK